MRRTALLTMIGGIAAIATAVTVAFFSSRDERRDVGGAGISISVPQEWSSYVQRPMTVPGGYRHGIILAAANFPLPRPDDDVGTSAMRKMRHGNARILLTEFYAPSRARWKRQFPSLRAQLVIKSSDFTHLEGFPWKHADAQRLFSTGGRYFGLVVDFTDGKTRDRLMPVVNDSLRTFAVHAVE